MLFQIPEKLVSLVYPKRFKVIIGGRGGTKSETAASLICGCVAKLGCRAVCCREYQTSIKQSVHSLMKRKIRDIGIPGFRSTEIDIKHDNGGHIMYQGLARDPQAIKSIDEARYAWVEEAQSLSHDSIEELTPSIRADGSEIWFTANLGNSKDPFSKRFVKPFEKELRKHGRYEDDLHLIIWINYDENPWFPDHLEKERVHDKAVLTDAEYAHKWLGEFNDTVENAIIAPAWFDACVDAHEKLGIRPAGVEVVSHDPSDTGFDNKGLAYRHGILIVDVQEEATGDINEGADWAADYAHGVKPDMFVWDADGLGIGLRRQFTQAFSGKSTHLVLFKGSSSVDEPESLYERDDVEATSKTSKTNRETFRNKRAQRYWDLRDRCWRTYQAVVKKRYTDPTQLISFSSKIESIDLLRSEICSVPLKHNGAGLIQIMNKQEMASMGIDSPNMADSVMMSLEQPKMRRQRRPELPQVSII